MKLKHSVVRIDKGLDAIKKRFEILRMRGAYVKAGVMGDKKKRKMGDKKKRKAGVMGDKKKRKTGVADNAQIASIHEFGLGHVPARPFIRPPFLKNRDEYLKLLAKAYEKALLHGNASEFERVLGLLGMKMVADIKNFVTQGDPIPPPLDISTIDRKGSTRPLVDTSQMINSVTHQVIK